MNWINKVARAATAFPFSKFDSCSKIDKTPLITRLGRWAPPPPASTPTKPIFPKWLKSFLFGGFASCQPPEDPHGYYAKVFTVSDLRKTCKLYDPDPSMSDENWMENVFKRLHHDVVQRPFLEWAETEKGRQKLNMLPIEMEIIITPGTKKQVEQDIENTNDKTDFITFGGIEDSLADAWDLYDMRVKCNHHHVTVEELHVNVPTSPTAVTATVYRNLEWTGHKYWVVKGIYNNQYKGKQDPLITEGYELQLFDDVVVLNDLDAKRKPKRVVAYWWHPLCDDIVTNLMYNKCGAFPASFSATDMLTVMVNTPLALLTHGSYKFPIANGTNSGYGSDGDHVKWRDLSHPIKENYAQELQPHINTIFPNLKDRCNGTSNDFERKHIRRIPGPFMDANKNRVDINSIDELFHLNGTDLEILRSQLSLSVIIIKPPSFDVNTMHLQNSVPLTGNSIVQRHPKALNDVYASWDNLVDGYPVIVTQNEMITTSWEVGEWNREPWKRDPTKFQEKLDLERKLGGKITEIDKGKKASIQRSFLLKDWHVQLWLDLNDDKPRHFEGLYPRRVHSKPITLKWIREGYLDKGANGLVGGKVPFGRELVPMFARTTHFHRCDTNVQCGMCPKKRPKTDDLVAELVKTNSP